MLEKSVCSKISTIVNHTGIIGRALTGLKRYLRHWRGEPETSSG